MIEKLLSTCLTRLLSIVKNHSPNWQPADWDGIWTNSRLEMITISANRDATCLKGYLKWRWGNPKKIIFFILYLAMRRINTRQTLSKENPYDPSLVYHMHRKYGNSKPDHFMLLRPRCSKRWWKKLIPVVLNWVDAFPQLVLYSP